MKSPENSPHRLTAAQQFIREKASSVVDKLYPHRIRGQEDYDNLNDLREKIVSGKSAVVIFNHTFLGDPAIAMNVTSRSLGFEIPFTAPGSRKHYDWLRHPFDAVAMRLSQPLGIDLIPIVQHYDRSSYSSTTPGKDYREFVSLAKEAVNSQRTVFFIAPEGTRSPDGSLQPAQTGVKHLVRYNPNLWFLPMAIIPDKETKGYGFFSGHEVRVGSAFQKKDIVDDIRRDLEIQDAIMLRVARLLPQFMKGVYEEFAD